jgi:CheY-like chemotaxis protein
MTRTDHLSILIVDDQPEVSRFYKKLLADRGHLVETCYFAGESLRHVRERLFDVVVVDAKIPHRGAGLGGLILAEEVSAILGINAVLLMSQYDIRGEVAHYNPEFTFLPKPAATGDLREWVENDLLGRMRSLVEQQYGFVVMPYNDPAGDAWFREVLVPAMQTAGYAVRRMDQIPHTQPINTELLKRIQQAQFVVVYAPRQNANVYFEAGYAVALNKFVLFVACELENLPFDVRSHRFFRAAAEPTPAGTEELARFMSGLRGTVPGIVKPEGTPP